MIEEVLARTLLLAKTDLAPATPDRLVIDALTETRVKLVADEATLSHHAGQSAFVTAALLMLRSGHRVNLAAPDVAIIGTQPPLEGGKIVTSLQAFSAALFGKERAFCESSPQTADLSIFFGDTPDEPGASFSIRVGWRNWAAMIARTAERALPEATDWPIGAMGAGALAAAEAFKAAIRKLAPYAATPLFRDQYAPATTAQIELAPEEAAVTADLGRFDVVSAGAVANAFYYALLRLPGVRGRSRVIDADQNDRTNLNRNMLLTPRDLGVCKARTLSFYASGLRIEPVALRFDEKAASSLRLADHVLVGVDDIPSRWLVQKHCSGWLGMGATDLYSVQASYHAPGLACAGCLHPVDYALEGAAPTAAFVSFCAGLQLAALLVQRKAGGLGDESGQSSFFTPLRPETFLRGPIIPNPQCPLPCDLTATRAA